MSSSFTLRKQAEADFPTRWGHFRIMGFEGQFGPESSGRASAHQDPANSDRRKEEAVALVFGDIHAQP
ncbi:MAG TPA: GTP cyclohydrolase II, partial [Candidatus Angelobacter sp.]|nr:GTP cyclohydrolase II [Candidatus Angelobacter sp.]